MLMDRIEGKVTRKSTVVRMAPTLIVRESTRARAAPERASLVQSPEPYPKDAAPSLEKQEADDKQ